MENLIGTALGILETEHLRKLREHPPIYVMGVDVAEKSNGAYCLTKTVNGVTEVILAKRERDTRNFTEEVENLAKYFDAEIIVAR